VVKLGLQKHGRIKRPGLTTFLWAKLSVTDSVYDLFVRKKFLKVDAIKNGFIPE